MLRLGFPAAFSCLLGLISGVQSISSKRGRFRGEYRVSYSNTREAMHKP